MGWLDELYVWTCCTGVENWTGMDGIATASSCWINRFPTTGASPRAPAPRLSPSVLALLPAACSHLLSPPRRPAGSCTLLCRAVYPGYLLTYLLRTNTGEARAISHPHLQRAHVRDRRPPPAAHRQLTARAGRGDSGESGARGNWHPPLRWAAMAAMTVCPHPPSSTGSRDR